MLNIFFWIIFGLLAGWVEAQVSDHHTAHHTLQLMVAGVVGALAGGQLVIGGHAPGTYNGTSIIIAAITAVIFAGVSSYIISRHAR